MKGDRPVFCPDVDRKYVLPVWLSFRCGPGLNDAASPSQDIVTDKIHLLMSVTSGSEVDIHLLTDREKRMSGNTQLRMRRAQLHRKSNLPGASVYLASTVSEEQKELHPRSKCCMAT